MKRVHLAILAGEMLSYLLIVTFIFADATFDLTSIFRPGSGGLDPDMAFVGACLVGFVGTVNVWLTWYYVHKSNAMRDWLVVCAWTHRVKCGGRWLTMEEFLAEHLGFNVSHGLSDPSLLELSDELDAHWRRFDSDPAPEMRDPVVGESLPSTGRSPNAAG